MGRKILITGAGSGLGEGAAIGMARDGHEVIAAALSWPQVTALRAKAEALALRLLRVEKLDLLEPYDVQHACSWDFDILVNNAGIGEGGPLCCRDESVPSVARSDIDGSVSSRASFHIVTVEDVDPLTRPA